MPAVSQMRDSAAWRGMESLEERFLLSGSETFDGSVPVGGVKAGSVEASITKDAQGNITNDPELHYLRVTLRARSTVVNFKVENYTKTFPAGDPPAMSFRVQVVPDSNNDGVLDPGERDAVSVLQQQGVAVKRVTLAPGAVQTYSKITLARGSYWITIRPVGLATPTGSQGSFGEADYRVTITNSTAAVAQGSFPEVLPSVPPATQFVGLFSQKDAEIF